MNEKTFWEGKAVLERKDGSYEVVNVLVACKDPYEVYAIKLFLEEEEE